MGFWGDTCSSWYDAYEYCGSTGCDGQYDDDDFSAAIQCCVCIDCRGNGNPKPPPRKGTPEYKKWVARVSIGNEKPKIKKRS